MGSFDLTPERLHLMMPFEVAQTIDAYQLEQAQGSTIPDPTIPIAVETSHPELTEALRNNKELYDDQTEAVIDNDFVIQAFLGMKEHHRQNEDLAVSVRVRRAVVVRILLESIDIFTVPEQTTSRTHSAA